MSIWCSINQFQDHLIVKNIYLIPLVWGVFELRRAINQFIIFQKKLDQFLLLSDKYENTLKSINVKVDHVFNGTLKEYPFLNKLYMTLNKINRIVNIPSNNEEEVNEELNEEVNEELNT